eukprot:TRINITY_DN66672_c11_g2_i1.p1 TRINITY_DN66672_c11_g2~~TRINITY_DN66672_c11_g2_i1.p1  ORF type:complete len:298 (-),score=172.39 TRINITY_DN66672_c11_g2_i1:59-952(-)
MGVRLVSLYKYEFSRAQGAPKTLDMSAQLARMYQSNCATLIGDESCCQMEFFDDTRELGIGLVTGMAAADRTEAPEEWNAYLDKFLSEPAKWSNVQVDGHVRPFLLRNAKRVAASVADDGDLAKTRADVIGRRLLQQVHVKNGLEAKICMRTYKTHYVEESEDVMVRSQPAGRVRRPQLISKRRAARGRAWLQSRLAELFPDVNFESIGSVDEALAQQHQQQQQQQQDDDGAAPMEQGADDDGVDASTAKAGQEKADSNGAQAQQKQQKQQQQEEDEEQGQEQGDDEGGVAAMDTTN